MTDDVYVELVEWTPVSVELAAAPALEVELQRGIPGAAGVDGTDGVDGVDGVGVPVGGDDGQVLAKASGADYDTEWVDQTGGGGGSIVIADLAEITALAADDNFLVDDGSGNKRILFSNLRQGIRSLYDEAGVEVLRGEGGFAKILDGRGLSGHGKLDTSNGFDAGGDVGIIESWMPVTSTNFAEASWFGFALSETFGALLIGFLEDKWLEFATGEAGTTVNVFLRPGQTGVAPGFILWDEDGNKSFTIADAEIDGGTDGPNATAWWSPSRDYKVGIYALEEDPEVFIQTPAAGWDNFGTHDYVESRWHKRPGDGRGVFMRGGADNFVRIIAASGQAESLFLLQTAASADLLNISLTGATLSLPLAMSAHKITGLANGSSSDDAAAFGQIGTAISALSTVYQPLDSDLTAIAALSTTSFGRSFLALADAAAGRTALGLGTAATQATGAFDAAGAAAAAQAASQPLDSDLTAIAALTTTSYGRALLALADGAALAALIPSTSITSTQLAGSIALSKLANQADATILGNNSGSAGPPLALTATQVRTLLALGTAALVNTGTGATNAILGNDSRLTDSRTPTAHASSHTSAGSDPVTVAESQVTNLVTDLAAKAPLASPALTGTPTAPTPSASDNSTKVATTAYVDTADALKAPIASPAFTGNPTAPTATVGDNDTSIATTSFVQSALLGFSIFGTGADGALNFDGVTAVLGVSPSSSVYTLARDIHASSISISSGVTIATNGFSIYCTGTITGAAASSLISHNGVNAGGGTNNSNAGGGAATSGSSTINGRGSTTALALGGVSGATGTPSAGVTGTAQGIGGRGGAGGNGSSGTGGASGTVNTPAASVRSTTYFNVLMATAISVGNASPTFSGFQGGTGGGGGGGDATNLGGGGGGGGGIVHIIARKFAGTGSIQARGGTGSKPTSGNTGGGGGGGGGAVLLISQSALAGAVSGWTIDANGGSPGALTGTGLIGNAGANGTTLLLTA